MYDSAKKYLGKVVYGTNELPPSVKKVLNEVGDAVITSAEIGRTPVQSFITGIIKIVSSTPYEKLFHLFILLHTTKGDVLFEKNERINMEKRGMPSNAESIKVPNVPSGLTVQQLVDNTAKYLGDFFIVFDASKANCQDFQMGILTSNNMLTPELKAFVKQDTTAIFKSPWFRKFANTVTDVAGRANIAYQGGQTKAFNPVNELSNFDIDKWMRHYQIKDYHGCYIKSDLPKKLQNGFFVINLNGHSHWTGLCKDGAKYYYFDSYGFVAPNEVEDRIPKEYVWSDTDIQTMSSSACGYYVMAWIRCLYHSKNKGKAYDDFMNLFDANKVNNENILKRLL
jgi:hypothetical protein